MTGTIIAMGVTAVATSISEKLADIFGKQDLGQMIAIGGFSLLGCEALGLVIKLVATCKKLGV